MLEGRFEPAGGGLRLVWAFWAVGGRAHAGMCCCVGSEASRPARGRAARRKRERGQSCNRLLQPNRAGARSNRPPLSLRDSARWTRHYDSVSGRGDHARSSIGPSFGGSSASLQKLSTLSALGLKVPFSHGCPFCFYSHTAGRPGALLSRESRSLAAPSEPARARAVLKPPSGRGKQPRLSRGSSMGAWPSRRSNGLPLLRLDTEARVFRVIFVKVL